MADDKGGCSSPLSPPPSYAPEEEAKDRKKVEREEKRIAREVDKRKSVKKDSIEH